MNAFITGGGQREQAELARRRGLMAFVRQRAEKSSARWTGFMARAVFRHLPPCYLAWMDWVYSLGVMPVACLKWREK